MATDRAGARRRVKTITTWAAAGAAVLTAGFALGAARQSPAGASSPQPRTSEPSQAQSAPAPDADPYQEGQGFAPPAASSGPPDATSGGS